MNTHESKQDGWWHERPTKAAELRTMAAPIYAGRRPENESVWFKAAVTVGLVVALGLSLIGLVGR
jgi:hypothetical protein